MSYHFIILATHAEGVLARAHVCVCVCVCVCAHARHTQITHRLVTRSSLVCACASVSITTDLPPPVLPTTIVV
jgi:hypothetical protein